MALEPIIFFLDKIGILAFAFDGVAKGVRKKLDIFGLLVVGICTAIGGGITRDLMLGKVPYAIENIDYMGYASAAAILSILSFSCGLRINKHVFHLADTIGLATFAASGAAVALNAELSVFHVILFAVVTAVGGGAIRDVFINDIPFILKKEVYATAALIGGLAASLTYSLVLNLEIAIAVCLFVTGILRTLAVTYNYNLPFIRLKKKR